MNHCSSPAILIQGDNVRFESGLGCNLFAAYRTDMALCPPNFQQQLFASICTVEQFFTFTLFVISDPSLIEGISFCNDFVETNDFRIGRVDQRKIRSADIFASGIQYCCKRPHTVFDVVPITLGNPFVSLVLMSAFCPLPQAFVDLIVHETEHI